VSTIIALIPGYEEGPRIAAVVEATARHLPVLVVDDGSTDDTAAQAEAAGATVLRQDPNAGKGAALRAGFWLGWLVSPPELYDEIVFGKQPADLHTSTGTQMATYERLKKLNPKFTGDVKTKIEDGVVSQFEFAADDVSDISPVRALSGLRLLHFCGVAPARLHRWYYGPRKESHERSH